MTDNAIFYITHLPKCIKVKPTTSKQNTQTPMNFEKHLNIKIMLEIPRRRMLVSDYRFTINGTLFVIKKGFWTDFASYNQALYSFLGSPYDSDKVFAALVHDIFYGTQYYNRKKADQIFYDMLVF